MIASSKQPLIETPLPTTIIEASSSRKTINLREIWQYRVLLYFLVWRILKVRYKQTVVGAAWAILQPLSMMIVFSVFLGALVRVPSGNLPYPLLVFSGLVPWTVFANGMGQAANSVVGNGNLLTKVYFPRLIIPIAPVIAVLLDFVMAFVVLIVVMLFYGYVPTINVIWLPVFLALAVIAALGVGFWLSALYVTYRDIYHLIPILTQAWFFATPVTYPGSLVPESWHLLYYLNPMAVSVQGFRWALFASDAPTLVSVVLSTLIALLLLVSGAYYFRSIERTFAERV